MTIEKLSPKPETNPVTYQVFEVHGEVMVVFERDIRWLKFSPEQSRELAKNILTIADAIDGHGT